MKRFHYNHRVQLREADLAGHVFYVNHLAIVDDARNQALKEIKFSINHMTREDMILVVADLNFQF